MRYLTSLLLAALLTACSAPPPGAELGGDHVLVGRIWDVAAGTFVERDKLLSKIVRAEFILLGEKHDNPDHHRLQAEIVAALGEAGRRPAVAFEMLNINQAARLKSFLSRNPSDARFLGDAVGWEKSGWPNWPMYAPIADAALKAKLPIHAANFSRKTARRIGREGLSALDPAVVRRTNLKEPLPEAISERLSELIFQSHCRMMPKKHLKPVVLIQRARDAVMADALATAAQSADGAVLITGNGHARNDWAVPYYLNTLAPGTSVTSVAFVEVRDELRRSPQYAEGFGVAALPFDFVWFTHRLEDTDPCEKFKAQLQRFKKRKN